MRFFISATKKEALEDSLQHIFQRADAIASDDEGVSLEEAYKELQVVSSGRAKSLQEASDLLHEDKISARDTSKG